MAATGSLADLMTDDATDSGPTHGSRRTPASQNSATHGANASPDNGVPVARRHAGTPPQAQYDSQRQGTGCENSSRSHHRSFTTWFHHIGSIATRWRRRTLLERRPETTGSGNSSFFQFHCSHHILPWVAAHNPKIYRRLVCVRYRTEAGQATAHPFAVCCHPATPERFLSCCHWMQ